ncbi:uncharacterized protein LOC108664963 [Hyalella azteca]|uniref:Uncharacterized protein LOC108664963 n=1 Tax=Hyalella azteca TaxID=294128 RepID=A0A8B7N010_HYAAZ|nr:uncharacterized protein LOC108664963 [Hyalella azteca]
MKLTKFSAWDFLLKLLLLECATGILVSRRFSKIRGSFVEHHYCDLATPQVPTSTKFLGLRGACSLMCQNTADCRFFCLLESKGTCSLFSAYVAVRWQGHPPSPSGTAFDACYTSWGDPRDVVKTTSPFNYSSVYPGASTSFVHAIDGYACEEPGNRFVTIPGANCSSQIDLEQITRVQTVILATANGDYIEDMDVFLGNTTDFTLGQKIGRVDGRLPAWSTYTINTNTSVAGRYITFFMALPRYHGYAEVQVIPLP